MSKAMTSERIQRLNKLLHVLKSCSYSDREKLMHECNYQSVRTLEGDLRFLKRSFGAKIKFSRRNNGYRLEDSGSFILFNINKGVQSGHEQI